MIIKIVKYHTKTDFAGDCNYGMLLFKYQKPNKVCKTYVATFKIYDVITLTCYKFFLKISSHFLLKLNLQNDHSFIR